MTNEETKKEWLTVRETAERLGVHEESVRRMIRTFKLPAQRAGGGERAPWLINAAALEHRLERDAARERFERSGAIVGYGDAEEKLEASDLLVSETGDPADAVPVVEDFRRRRARNEALYELARAADESGAELARDFDQLDEEEAIEQAAQRRAAFLRKEERIRQRTLELLEDEENEDA